MKGKLTTGFSQAQEDHRSPRGSREDSREGSTSIPFSLTRYLKDGLSSHPSSTITEGQLRRFNWPKS